MNFKIISQSNQTGSSIDTNLLPLSNRINCSEQLKNLVLNSKIWQLLKNRIV